MGMMKRKFTEAEREDFLRVGSDVAAFAKKALDRVVREMLLEGGVPLRAMLGQRDGSILCMAMKDVPDDEAKDIFMAAVQEKIAEAPSQYVFSLITSEVWFAKGVKGDEEFPEDGPVTPPSERSDRREGMFVLLDSAYFPTASKLYEISRTDCDPIIEGLPKQRIALTEQKEMGSGLPEGIDGVRESILTEMDSDGVLLKGRLAAKMFPPIYALVFNGVKKGKDSPRNDDKDSRGGNGGRPEAGNGRGGTFLPEMD
jgi:hypothetical protein